MFFQTNDPKLLSVALTLILLMSFPACKKTNDTHRPGVDSQFILVLEDKTEKPIEGATLSFQNCRSDYMSLICNEVLSGNTNNKGLFTFPAMNYSAVIANHSGYWRGGISGAGTMYLIPEAWQKVHLVRNNSYSPAAKLVLYNSSTDTITYSQPDLPSSLLVFGLGTSEFLTIDHPVADTIVYIRALGRYHDYISWSVYIDPGNSLSVGQIATGLIDAFDTANVQINY